MEGDIVHNLDNDSSLVGGQSMKTAGKRKMTVGTVIQTFDDDNKCIEQEFIAGDEVDYEDADGNRIDTWDEYQPFEMVQPGEAEKLAEMKNSLAEYEAREYDRQQGD